MLILTSYYKIAVRTVVISVKRIKGIVSLFTIHLFKKSDKSSNLLFTK